MESDIGPITKTSQARPDPRAMYTVGALAASVRRLADRLEAAMRELHAGDGLTVGERALLLELRRGDAQTIPALAARRGTTRQYVQQTLAPLAARGLVAWRDNPRHRRSRLAALSPAGVELARRVLAREGALAGEIVGELAGEAAPAVLNAQLVEAAASLAAMEAALGRALPAVLAAAVDPPPPRAAKAQA